MKKITGQHINYGFKIPEIKVEDHIFGVYELGGAIINTSGQYDAYRPQYEAQADNFETQGCTVWGTENALETLHKFKFGVEKNYEELPVYIGAGVRPESGGDPNNVAQWIRDNGLTESPTYPFPKTLEALLALLGKPLPQNIVDLGRNWLSAYSFRHQWVLYGHEGKEQRIAAIKSALPYGVLGVSVTAWFQDEEGVYVDNGRPNSHWCQCDGWTDKGWRIFDSYDHSDKIYSFDSNINFAKLYFLDKKITPEVKKKWYDGLIAFFRAFLSPKDAEETIKKLEPLLNPMTTETKPKVQTVKERLKEVCLDSIGQDLSIQAPNELGCADSLANLLRRVFPDFPSFISTRALWEHFRVDKRFTNTKLVKSWSIIISPTGQGNGTLKNGHAGILGENEIIYSNNSATGFWDKHWLLEDWVKYYRGKGGFPVLFYEV